MAKSRSDSNNHIYHYFWWYWEIHWPDYQYWCFYGDTL